MNQRTRWRWTWIVAGLVLTASIGLLTFVLLSRSTPDQSPAAGSPVDRGTATLPVELNDQTRLYLKELNPDEINAWEQSGSAASSKQQYHLGLCHALGVHRTQSPSTAMRLLESAAGGKLREAQFLLARVLLTGRLGVKDEIRGAMWMREAAEQGLTMAQRDLANLYETARGVPFDLQECVLWLHTAAAGGSDAAKRELLRVLIRNGRDPLTKDEWKSRATELAKKNDAAGVYVQGMSFKQTDGKDAKAGRHGKDAMGFFQRAASDGYPPAQFEFGLGLLLENDVTKVASAMDWIRKSADAGWVPALLALVEISKEKPLLVDATESGRRWLAAVQSLRQRAERGDAAAGVRLAALLLDSDRSRLSEITRLLWQGVLDGRADAQFLLGYLFVKEAVQSPTPRLGVQLLRRAAEQGHAQACLELGLAYRDGKDGLQRNDVEAVRWISAAAEQRLPDAVRELARAYRLGRGVPRDVKLAEQLEALLKDKVAATPTVASAGPRRNRRSKTDR